MGKIKKHQKKMLIILSTAVIALALIKSFKSSENSISSNESNHTLSSRIKCDESSIYIYDFENSTTGSYMDPVSKNSSAVAISLTGQISLQCTSQKENKYQLEFITIKPEIKNSSIENLQKIVGSKISFNKTNDGLLEKIGMREFDDVMTTNFIQGILSQISPKAIQGVTEWSSQETDYNGKFFARYKATDSQSFTKEIQYYLKNSRTDIFDFNIKHSESTYKIVKNQINSIVSNFEYTVNNSKQQLSKAQVFFKLRLNNRKNNDIYPSMTNSSAQPPLEMQSTEEINSNIKETLKRKSQLEALGGDDWESLSKLFEYPKNLETADLYLKLRALFYLHPEAIDIAINHIRSRIENIKLFDLITMAIAWNESDFSQNALVQFLDEEMPEKNKNYLLQTLGSLNNANSETELAITRIINNEDSHRLQQVGRYARASIASTFKNKNIARYDEIVGLTLKDISECKDSVSCLNSLRVLINIGDQSSVDVAKAYLKSSEKEIRKVALSTMRFVEDSSVDTILISYFQSDSEEEVRYQALVELIYRKSNVEKMFDILQNQMKKESSASVRIKILEKTSQLEVSSELITFYQQVYKNDISEDVRHQAEAYLIRYGKL